MIVESKLEMCDLYYADLWITRSERARAAAIAAMESA